MPIWFVIYQLHTVYNGYGIKHILYAIPTTFEQADQVFKKYVHVINNHELYPHPQVEYVAREDPSYLTKESEAAKHGFNPDGTFDEEKFRSSVVDYNNSKEW